MRVALLLVRAGQLVPLAGPAAARSGRGQGDLAILADGAVAVSRGRILEVGPTRSLRAKYEARELVDARGAVVTPGLVDPHTHAVFAGSREGSRWRRGGEGLGSAGDSFTQFFSRTRWNRLFRLVR